MLVAAEIRDATDDTTGVFGSSSSWITNGSTRNELTRQDALKSALMGTLPSGDMDAETIKEKHKLQSMCFAAVREKVHLSDLGTDSSTGSTPSTPTLATGCDITPSDVPVAFPPIVRPVMDVAVEELSRSVEKSRELSDQWQKEMSLTSWSLPLRKTSLLKSTYKTSIRCN
ncbi:hypothetical protein BASA60_009585 [Batrachochytrium salamandrivorans]|nr:hypothetical protein BASA60_009585 [Batrachochytrium salamandrivorans]